MHKSLVGTSEILQLMLTYIHTNSMLFGEVLGSTIRCINIAMEISLLFSEKNWCIYKWWISSLPCQAVFCSSVAIDWKIWRAAAHTTVAQKHLWHLSDGPSTARLNPWSLDLQKQFRPQDRTKEPFANWKWQNKISRNNPVKISIILHSVQMMSLEIKRLWGERSSETMRNCPNRTR